MVAPGLADEEGVPSSIGRESTTMTENRLPDAQACSNDFSTTDDLQLGVNICIGAGSIRYTDRA
jgi:hypothetical protein